VPRAQARRPGRGVRRGAAAVPRREGGVRLHYRFRNRGANCLSESGMKWMSGISKRQCDQTPRTGRAVRGLRARASRSLRRAGKVKRDGTFLSKRTVSSMSVCKGPPGFTSRAHPVIVRAFAGRPPQFIESFANADKVRRTPCRPGSWASFSPL
jgi:hypothetical protein